VRNLIAEKMLRSIGKGRKYVCHSWQISIRKKKIGQMKESW